VALLGICATGFNFARSFENFTEELSCALLFFGSLASRFRSFSFCGFQIFVGSGLALTSVRTATVAGAKTFLTLGAIYFVAAQAFGFAVGGHVTGRLLPPALEESKEERFRADAHGLAVWTLAVVFGLGFVTLAAFATASAAGNQATTPAAYWADKLLAPSGAQPIGTATAAPAPTGPDGSTATSAGIP
jgi:hypothetical protein